MARHLRNQSHPYCRNSKQTTKNSKKYFESMWLDYAQPQPFPPMGERENCCENSNSYNKQRFTLDSRVRNIQLDSYEESFLPEENMKFDQNGFTSTLDDSFQRRPWRARGNSGFNAQTDENSNTNEDTEITNDETAAAAAAAAVSNMQDPLGGCTQQNDMSNSSSNSSYENNNSNSNNNNNCNEWPCPSQIYYEQYLYSGNSPAASDPDIWSTDAGTTSAAVSMNYFPLSTKSEQIDVNFQNEEYTDLTDTALESDKMEISYEDEECMMENCPNARDTSSSSSNNNNNNNNPFADKENVFNPDEVDNCAKKTAFEFRSPVPFKYPPQGTEEDENKNPLASSLNHLPHFNNEDPGSVKRRRKYWKDDFSQSSETFEQSDAFSYPSTFPKNRWNQQNSRLNVNSDDFYPRSLNKRGFNAYNSDAMYQPESPFDGGFQRSVYDASNRRRTQKVWNETPLDFMQPCDENSFWQQERYPRPPNNGRFSKWPGWDGRKMYLEVPPAYGYKTNKNKRFYRTDSYNGGPYPKNRYNEKWKSQTTNRKRFYPREYDENVAEDSDAVFIPFKKSKRFFTQSRNAKNFNPNPPLLESAKQQLNAVYPNFFPPFPTSYKPFGGSPPPSGISKSGFNNHQNSSLSSSRGQFNRRSYAPRSSDYRWRQSPFPPGNPKVASFRSRNSSLKISSRMTRDIGWPNINPKSVEMDSTNNALVKPRTNRFPWGRAPCPVRGNLLPSDGRGLRRASQLQNQWVSFDALTPFDLLLSTRNGLLSLSPEVKTSSLPTLPSSDPRSCLVSAAAKTKTDVQPQSESVFASPLSLPLKSKDQSSAQLTGIGLLLSSPLSPNCCLGVCCVSRLNDNRQLNPAIMASDNNNDTSSSDLPPRTSSSLVDGEESKMSPTQTGVCAERGTTVTNSEGRSTDGCVIKSQSLTDLGGANPSTTDQRELPKTNLHRSLSLSKI